MDKNRIIKTFTGKKAKRSDCKRIRGQYYLVGDVSIKDSGECYKIEDQYHRFNNGLIEYDHNVKKYVLIHKNHLKSGIVDINNEEPIIGFYTPNLVENVVLRDDPNKVSKDLHCISEEIALKLGYKERLGDGIFYSTKHSSITAKFLNEISNKIINKSRLPYDSRFSQGITKNIFNSHFKPDYSNNQLNVLGDWLEDNGITFGVEFETSTGYVAERLCYKYGVLALRDGSIDGLEYVTIPLSGKKGLYALKGICEELKKRTKFDIKCALHIHVGGLKREENSILASYNLGYLLQDELFEMQPFYKRGNTGYHNNPREKDYSKKIAKSVHDNINEPKTLKEKFARLFYMASDSRSYDNYNNDLKKVKKHPSDPKGTSKWNIHSRYTWLNLVPIIFGNKKTLEFRQHSPTFEFEKVVNFLIFCSTFVKFVNINSDKLADNTSDLYKELKSSSNKLEYVIKKSLPLLKFKDIIERYVSYNSLRTKIMETLKAKKDYLGKNEAKFDSMYGALTKDNFWN